MNLTLMIIILCITTSTLMFYEGYIRSSKRVDLLYQLDLVDEKIENCDDHFRLKKLIKLRKKIKKKIDSA